ncbi:MAG: hypothetical protein K6A82_09610 [Prevotella sp.]|nr:hypothetical protein [Prevotella sp.]
MTIIILKVRGKDFMNFDRQEEDTRRAELIRILEHSIERLTLPELEALYYDLVAKDYIRK